MFMWFEPCRNAGLFYICIMKRIKITVDPDYYPVQFQEIQLTCSNQADALERVLKNNVLNHAPYDQLAGKYYDTEGHLFEDAEGKVPFEVSLPLIMTTEDV
jgi:hypothetical protein